MKKSLYDFERINRIMMHFEDDPYGTITKFEQYLIDYPRDYSAYPYYCGELIKIGEFEKAKRILEEVEKRCEKDNDYFRMKDRDIARANLIFTRIKLLSYTKKYSKCLRLAKKHLVFLKEKNISLNRLTIFLDKKLGLSTLKRSKDYPYGYNQIIDYSEKEFLEHSKKHQYEYTSEEERIEYPVFCKDFKLNEVFDVIKKNIPNDKKLNVGTCENTYYYKYDGCGTVDGKKVDYFLVVTNADSAEFITMHPTDIGPKVPYTDLNYLLIEEKPKTLQKSRIDRFNEKYGIKVDKK